MPAQANRFKAGPRPWRMTKRLDIEGYEAEAPRPSSPRKPQDR
jgi:hypothetical protein